MTERIFLTLDNCISKIDETTTATTKSGSDRFNWPYSTFHFPHMFESNTKLALNKIENAPMCDVNSQT